MPNIFSTITSAAAASPAPAAVILPPVQSLFNGSCVTPSPGYQVPVAPATKTLYSYQVSAVETILTHRRCILGYQPGMGKTAILQAVTAANAAQGGRTICVVPPSLRISPWAEDYAADFPGLRVAMVEGQKASAIPADADVAIVGDSVLKHRLQDLFNWGASLVTVDEGHRFKNRTAKRTIALLALADLATTQSAVIATGTLAANNAGDVYAPLRISGKANAVAVSQGESWTRFMDAWCESEMVWTGRNHVRVVTGCVDAQALRAKLLSTCMISVPREDVLDLPDRIFPVRNLVLNGDAIEYRRMERDFLSWVKEAHGDAAAMRAAKAEAITKMMKLWEADGLAKVNATVEYVEAMTDQDEQVVVMAWHSSVIQALYSKLSAKGITVATVIGGTSGQQKADTVNKFQAGNTQVLVGQIAAAGVGITLHAAHNLVFAQLPWSPASFAQASDRIYRIGQRNACSVHVLNGVGMVSQKLWDVLQAKAQVCDAINTGVESTISQESVIEAVLSDFGW